MATFEQLGVSNPAFHQDGSDSMLMRFSAIAGPSSAIPPRRGVVPVGDGVILDECVAPVALKNLLRPTRHLVLLQTGKAGGSRVSLDPDSSGRAYRAGDIDVVPSGQDAAWRDDVRDRVFGISLPVSLMQQAARELDRQAGEITLAPRRFCHDPRLEHLAQALRTELETGSVQTSPHAADLAGLLVRHLVRHETATSSTAASLQSRLSPLQLQRITRFIDDRLALELRIRDLAEVVDYSVSHFAELFRRSAGMSVHRYVMQRRVLRARDLLAHGCGNVCDVALETGFSHQSHLARWMRRVLGATPRSVQPSAPRPSRKR